MGRGRVLFPSLFLALIGGLALCGVGCDPASPSSASPSQSAGARWTVDPSGGITGGRDLASVSLDASGKVGFAVGWGGVVLRWDGLRWQGDEAAMKAANGVELRSVAVDASGERALAVGGEGMVLSWDGSTWKHEPEAEKLASERAPFAVRFDEGKRSAWVVGQYGIALRWNGSQWSRVRTPFTVPSPSEGGAPIDVFGMWAVWGAANGTDAWAIGNGSRVLRWNGRDWRDDNSATSPESKRNPFTGLNSLAMSKDGKKGWMVGNPADAGEANLVWSGSQWQRSPSPAGTVAEELLFSSVACDATGTVVLAVGGDGRLGRWDGKGWTVDPASKSAAEGKNLSAVALNESGNVGFAVGSGGVILRWDGKDWKRDPAGDRLGNGQYSAVAASADGKVGLVVSPYSDNVPLRWDGKAWTLDSSRRVPEMRMNALWMSPTGNLAFGASEEGIYRWDGSEWTAQVAGSSLHTLAMTPDGRLGFTGGVGGVIHRYDGSRWIEDAQGTTLARGRSLYAMAQSEDGKIGFAAGNGVFLRWDGATWREETKLSQGTYQSLCLNAKGDLGFSLGTTFLRWDGKTWHPDNQASKVFTDNGPYQASLSADGSSGIAASFDGPVYVWNGTAWKRDERASELAQGQNPVSVWLDPSGRAGWVLGWNGFLMRYDADGTP